MCDQKLEHPNRSLESILYAPSLAPDMWDACQTLIGCEKNKHTHTYRDTWLDHRNSFPLKNNHFWTTKTFLETFLLAFWKGISAEYVFQNVKRNKQAVSRKVYLEFDLIWFDLMIDRMLNEWNIVKNDGKWRTLNKGQGAKAGVHFFTLNKSPFVSVQFVYHSTSLQTDEHPIK